MIYQIVKETQPGVFTPVGEAEVSSREELLELLEQLKAEEGACFGANLVSE